MAGSINIGMFIAFRFFSGLGAYMQYVNVPLWIIEMAPPKGRSVLGGICGLFGVVGYILAAYVGVGFFYYSSDANVQWRIPLALGCASPLILLCLMPWLPESPRWLMAKGKEDQAWRILQSLHRDSNEASDDDDGFVHREFTQIKEQCRIESVLDSSWLDMLRKPSYRKRTILAFFLPVIVYSTGNLVVTTYASSLFTELGYDSGESLELLAGLYVAAIIGNLISLLYVDRVPRNVIFSVGIIADICVLAIETALVATYLGSDNKTGLQAAVSFLFIFLFVFNLFLEGPSWYYASEIFPTHLRAKGITTSVIGMCLVNILWLMVAPTAFADIEWKFYLVFICISVVTAVIVYFVYPNTLHKPLEEIGRLFGDEDTVTMLEEDLGKDAISEGSQEKISESHTENVELGK